MHKKKYRTRKNVIRKNLIIEDIIGTLFEPHYFAQPSLQRLTSWLKHFPCFMLDWADGHIHLFAPLRAHPCPSDRNRNGRDEALPRPCDGWLGRLRRRLHCQRHVAGRGGVSARGGRLRAADRVGRGPDQRAGGAKIIKSGRLLHTKYPEPLRTKRWKARTTLNEKDAEHFVRSTAIGLGHYLEVGFLAACDNLQPHGARFKEISLHAGQ